MGSPRDYALTFAGAGIQEIKARGRFIRILEAPSSNVWVEVDGGSELKRVAGQDVDFGGDFNRFRIRSAVAQTVLLTVSDTRQADDQESVSVSVSATVTPGNTLNNDAEVSVPAVSTATVKAAAATTLAVNVYNPVGNTREVRVGTTGVGATTGRTLEPGDDITLATEAAVAVYNPHSSAQTVEVVSIAEV